MTRVPAAARPNEGAWRFAVRPALELVFSRPPIKKLTGLAPVYGKPCELASVFANAFIQAAKQRIEEIGHDAALADLQLGSDGHAGDQLSAFERQSKMRLRQVDEHAVIGSRLAASTFC